MKTTAYDITERELALITLMRNMRFGTLERVGIQDGQPSVIVSSAQRIDLTKDDERGGVLNGIGNVPIPLVPVNHETETSSTN